MESYVKLETCGHFLPLTRVIRFIQGYFTPTSRTLSMLKGSYEQTEEIKLILFNKMLKIIFTDVNNNVVLEC